MVFKNVNIWKKQQRTIRAKDKPPIMQKLFIQGQLNMYYAIYIHKALILLKEKHTAPTRPQPNRSDKNILS